MCERVNLGSENPIEDIKGINLGFEGKFLVIGLGSIGLGILPLLLRHFTFTKANPISILTGDDRADVAEEVYKEYGIRAVIEYLTPDNYQVVLEQFNLDTGDFIVNLSVDVSSLDIMDWCQSRGILYLDTVVEPWPGYYTNPNLSVSKRSNYALREQVVEYRKTLSANATTAVITHGANPGMVSHFVKQALLNIAKSWNLDVETPTTREGWAELGSSLGVQSFHISERDFQYTNLKRKQKEFINTWSVEGFLSEGCQPAEMGWGTHEKELPRDGAKHEFGCGAAIYLNRPGAGTRVKSWTPKGGPHLGYLITHNESISIADYFTVKNAEGNAIWRPTVFYAYRPCDEAVISLDELSANNFDKEIFTSHRVVVDEVEGGVDELGVLVLGTRPGRIEDETHVAPKPYAYWFGSELDCKVARTLAKHNHATSLQVTSSVLSAVMWAIRNPSKGICEPEDLPHDEILKVMYPYISPVVGEFTEWTSLIGRGLLFPEDIDTTDPWQFKNLRMS